MKTDYDIVIIGTGVGGGTLAYGLRDAGARILLIDRGDYLPQEPENWDAGAVFVQNRYKTLETWDDAAGQPYRQSRIARTPGCIASKTRRYPSSSY